MSTQTIAPGAAGVNQDDVILECCRRYAARCGYSGETAENVAQMYAIGQGAILHDVFTAGYRAGAML